MISIIVPIYNAAGTLPKCLDSLIGQTYSDLEIICIDDGSTDNSPEILAPYAARDSRIRVFRIENGGVDEARNEGIIQSAGQWLLFVDSDDWLSADCCEQLMEVAEGKDLVLFSYIREFKKGPAPKLIFDERPRHWQGEDMEQLYERFIAPGDSELRDPSKLDSLSPVWGKLYKADIIRSNKLMFPPIEKTGTLEDLLFNCRFLNYACSAIYLPSCLYHQRKSVEGSITYSFKPDLDKKWMYVFHAIEVSDTGVDRSWLLPAIERRKALCLFGLGLNISFSDKPLREQHQMLDGIIQSAWYKDAIHHLDLCQMPLYWRTFYSAARNRNTGIVLIMIQVMKRIVTR
jgi:glycosyltransferase EpsH